MIEKKNRVVPDTGFIDIKTIPKFMEKINSTYYKPYTLPNPPLKMVRTN